MRRVAAVIRRRGRAFDSGQRVFDGNQRLSIAFDGSGSAAGWVIGASSEVADLTVAYSHDAAAEWAGGAFLLHAGGLCHLVELAPAVGVSEREELPAEHKGLKLNYVHHNIDVETPVAGGVSKEFHRDGLSFCFSLIVNYTIAALVAARRAR